MLLTLTIHASATYLPMGLPRLVCFKCSQGYENGNKSGARPCLKTNLLPTIINAHIAVRLDAVNEQPLRHALSFLTLTRSSSRISWVRSLLGGGGGGTGLGMGGKPI